MRKHERADYDFVVVGGGFTGLCAAMTAARSLRIARETEHFAPLWMPPSKQAAKEKRNTVSRTRPKRLTTDAWATLCFSRQPTAVIP